MEIAIFKSGTHTDSSGTTAEFTPEQIVAMAEKNTARYNQNQYKVPAIISEEGHTNKNLPAYGWFTTFTTREEDGATVLYAELEEPMLEAFSNVIANQTYKNRSVSFNNEGMITHVAFLGAMPPAIKDLPEINMALSECRSFSEVNTKYDEAQNARATQYAISIKSPGAKPAESYTDEQYADPVNYKFPVASKEICSATLASWSKDSSQAGYTDAEKQVVAARMVKAALAYGITLTPYSWAYTVPESGVTEQQAASAKFGIAIKMVNSASLPENTQQAYQKPAALASLTDDQFGDPVNYRFPIHSKAYVLSSIKEFGSWENRDMYSEQERQFIFARLFEAAEALGVDVDKIGLSYYASMTKGTKSITAKFSSGQHITVPADSLSKKQLLDVVSKLSGTPGASGAATSQHASNPSTNQGTSMNEEQIKALFEELLQWASDTLGEEVATQLSAKKDELLTQYLQQAAAAGTDPGSQASAQGGTAATDPKYSEMQAEIDALKKTNRTAEFREFAKDLISKGHITPAQEQIVMNLMEAMHADKSSFSFTEGGKTKTASPLDALKSFMSSIKQVAVGEHASAGSAFAGSSKGNNEFSEFGQVDDERLELHNAAMKLVESTATSANPISYAQAIVKVSQGVQA